KAPTAHRRCLIWARAGVWGRLHEAVLHRLDDAGLIGVTRVVLDTAHVRAKKGGEHTGPSPVDRGKPGSKMHILSDANGLPLVVGVSAGNTHDVRIARKGIESSERLGRRRWVIERTISWLTGYRRLNHRYERHLRNY